MMNVSIAMFVMFIHTLGLFSSIYDYPFGRFMAILDEMILFSCTFSLHFIDSKAVGEI
jgi:hypothetical protein